MMSELPKTLLEEESAAYEQACAEMTKSDVLARIHHTSGKRPSFITDFSPAWSFAHLLCMTVYLQALCTLLDTVCRPLVG